MRSGPNRTRVEFQRRSYTVDDYGERIDSWQTIYSRWAELVFPAGRKYYQKDGLDIAKQPIVVRVRHDAELFDAVLPSDQWRIKLGSRFFDISSRANVSAANREIHYQAVTRAILIETFDLTGTNAVYLFTLDSPLNLGGKNAAYAANLSGVGMAIGGKDAAYSWDYFTIIKTPSASYEFGIIGPMAIGGKNSTYQFGVA
jgi:head-tail adaptor